MCSYLSILQIGQNRVNQMGSKFVATPYTGAIPSPADTARRLGRLRNSARCLFLPAEAGVFTGVRLSAWASLVDHDGREAKAMRGFGSITRLGGPANAGKSLYSPDH